MANPRLYDAFLAALEEATQIINADKPKAAEEYKRLARDPAPVEDLQALLNDPENLYTTDPLNIGRMVEFMHRTGQIRVQPASWRDLFFANMHGRSGA